MAYATINDVEAGFRVLTTDERAVAGSMLDEAALIIDSYGADADEDVKKLVSCRMVRRALGSNSVPIGATQGSESALGYSQSWTLGGGSSGELYVSKLEKKLIGAGNRIASRSPLEV